MKQRIYSFLLICTYLFFGVLAVKLLTGYRVPYVDPVMEAILREIGRVVYFTQGILRSYM